MAYHITEILENKEIAPGIYSLRVPAGEPVKPGQFYMLRRQDDRVLLPRAISVCDWSPQSLRFLYQVVGRGTRGLSRLREGDKLCLTGPLGNGFPVTELKGRVALVGGGIGAAPMLYAARRLQALGVEADCVMGYRDTPFLTGELESVCHGLSIATESGAAGQKGYVTGLLAPGGYDTVLTCGPTPMLRAVVELCREAGTPVYVSLENKMACGLGACLVCTCTDLAGQNRRTCKDGPVFRGEEINFDA